MVPSSFFRPVSLLWRGTIESLKGSKKIKEVLLQQTNNYIQLHINTQKQSVVLPMSVTAAEAPLGMDLYAQAQQCLSLIEDPLWKRVCAEVLTMMGAGSMLKIWKTTLGSFSAEEKTVDLYCQTEEVALFIQQYSFVMIGIFCEYFPSVTTLRTKII